MLETIILDNGKEFNNDAAKDILNLHIIIIHFITPAHHESNSIIERFHSTIIEHLRVLRELHPKETNNLMDYAIICYNSSIHSSTVYTSFELTFGHTGSRNSNEIFIPALFYSEYSEQHKRLKHVYEKVSQNLKESKVNMTAEFNTKGENNKKFHLGQEVYKQNPNTRNKMSNTFCIS